MANHNFVLGGNTIQNAPGVVVSDNVNDYYAPFTDDATATADEILEGYTAYGASGEKLTGTAQPTNTEVLYVYSDINGEEIKSVNGYGYVSTNFAPVKDNKFRFWIDLDSSDLTFKAPVSVATSYAYRHTGAIDWGDGSAITEYEYGNTNHTHTYSEPGRYCVSIWRTGGEERFSVDSPQASDRGKVVAIEFYMLNYPNNTMSGSLPNVRKLRYSSAQTTVSFSQWGSLEDVILPESTTTIKSCYQLFSLTKLTVPASVTSIIDGAFSNNTAMKEYHFLSTTPPTLGGNNVFTGIPNDCVIYVPSASLTAYQTAQYWSDYASKMVGE